jgi:hypothetical protein
MESKTYKNILLNSSFTEPSQVYQTYEEWLSTRSSIFDDKNGKECVPRISLDVIQYIEDRNVLIHEFVDHIKSKYGSVGLGNNITFEDIFNVLIKNMKVEPIINDLNEDGEYSAGDDEDQN